MDTIDYIFQNVLVRFEKFMYNFVNTGDPITTTIFLFVIFSPFALAYMIAMRIAMIKMQQMTIKGKNILYVIAHPDDEAM